MTRHIASTLMDSEGAALCGAELPMVEARYHGLDAAWKAVLRGDTVCSHCVEAGFKAFATGCAHIYWPDETDSSVLRCGICGELKIEERPIRSRFDASSCECIGPQGDDLLCPCRMGALPE